MKKYIFLISSLFVIACNENKQQTPQSIRTLPVIRVGEQSSTAQLSYPVNIEGVVNSSVQARVSGYITQVLVDEGATVTKGQPLFRLETQALSQSAQAAKSALEAAQVEVDKLIPLVEKNIVSNVQLQTAKANLNRAKANYAEVNANLDYAIVRAPVSGVVGVINVREGALVTANSTILTSVSDIKQIYAYFSMNESDYLNFLEKAPGKNINEKLDKLPQVSLLLANGQIYPHKGKIQTVAGQVDALTGSLRFRAVFDNPEKILTNGNSGTILIPEVFDNSIVIPESATFEQQGVVFAYKVEQDTLRQIVLTVKNRNNNLVVVEEGLQKGEVVIVQGLNIARSGMHIKPKEVLMDSLVQTIKPVFK
ncbi:MAG: efflux RND transporter periplasmic adaptor subunit [Bacteroidota bacterium]|nr:efflux RND transporter periplasmic adaptor subunit [Bacteroidota bacterium]